MQAYIYKQKNEDLGQIEKLLDCPSKTYIASSRDCSIYQQLKRDLEQKPGLLIISSIAAIGTAVVSGNALLPGCAAIGNGFRTISCIAGAIHPFPTPVL